jgi:hypothetical protein
MNLDWVSMVRVTGNDFVDVAILQLAAIGIAFGYAEILTRYRLRPRRD